MELWSVLLIAGAISIDAFAVAIVYGIKKMKLTFENILTISLSTTIVLGLAILLGKFLTLYLSFGIERMISGTLLFTIGLVQLFNGWKSRRINQIKKENPIEGPIKIFSIRIKTLGLILDIMADPLKADLDHSKNISIKEAILLSLALNVDALGAGISVGLIGYSFLLVPIAAITLILSMHIGLFIGKKYLSHFNEDNGYFVTGAILVLIGINSLI